MSQEKEKHEDENVVFRKNVSAFLHMLNAHKLKESLQKNCAG